MYCLYNGEYGEHDLSGVTAIEQIMKLQQKSYSERIGSVIGDFTVLNCEYDWGRHDQRWKCQCNLCGRVIYQYHTKDWMRSRGRSQQCRCRIEEKECIRQEKKEDLQKRIGEEVGRIYGDFEIVNYAGKTRCDVKCLKCGTVRKSLELKNVKCKKIKCRCNKADYSDPKWIGVRVGNLITIRREGQCFIARCDCGRERVVQTYPFFGQKRLRNCGDPDCEYMEKVKSKAQKSKDQGEMFELISDALVRSAGYKTRMVGKTGDFGVDIIASKEGEDDIAIQCKCNSHKKSGVKCIQEVYAGGRYYDLKRFAVISFSKISNQAIKMAKKLGVYICDGANGGFEFPEDIGKYTKELLPTYNHLHEINKKYYEFDGVKKTLGDWCFEYKVSEHNVRRGMKNGLSFENALQYAKEKSKKIYTINGFTGTKSEICRYFGILDATVNYRMNKGMTLEEAIFAIPKVGRPRKNPEK